MTRKRLKKLIMSYGYQRNDAEIMSWYANRTCKEYKEYFALHRIDFAFHKLSKSVGTSLKRTSKRMEKAATAIKEAFAGMRISMEGIDAENK